MHGKHRITSWRFRMTRRDLARKVAALERQVASLQRTVEGLTIPPDEDFYIKQLARGGPSALKAHNKRMRAVRVKAVSA